MDVSQLDFLCWSAVWGTDQSAALLDSLKEILQTALEADKHKHKPYHTAALLYNNKWFQHVYTLDEIRI